MVKGIKETIVIIWKDLAMALMVLEVIIMGFMELHFTGFV